MGERENRRDEGSTATGQSGLPLSRTAQQSELFDRVGDAEHMLAVFRRELPALADAEIQVTDCRARTSRSRKSIRHGRLEVVYKVGIEVDGGKRSEHVLFGIAPATPEFLDSVKEQRRRLRGHAWAAPFPDLALYLEELQLALLFFPLDPALPGLADITGSDGARLLATALPEGFAGARIERIACSLAHYKPFKRAVLKIRASFPGPRARARHRNVYAKFYANDRGAEVFRNLSALRSATQGATSLRLPEPLAYDAERHMLVMAEAAGERSLARWVKRLDQGGVLPAGVDLARLERCALVAARSLLELQRSGVRTDVRLEFREELARVKKDCDLMLEAVRRKQPDLAACADSLLRRLEDMAPEDEQLVPSHGGFRHDQMVGDEHSLTLVDWDGFALSSPALDAATFLARLRRGPRRNPGSAPELVRMAETFRATFLEHQPELARHLDLYEGLQVTEQILRAFRRPGSREETAREVRLLTAAASEMLDRVEKAPREHGGSNGAPASRDGHPDGRTTTR